NRELPDAPYFPVVRGHGRLPDGRVYLITTLFEEFPLATTISDERVPGKLVSYLQTTLAVAAALGDLHRLQTYLVRLNPMNILLKAIALNPHHRYPSMDGFSAALTRYLERIWPGRLWSSSSAAEPQ